MFAIASRQKGPRRWSGCFIFIGKGVAVRYQPSSGREWLETKSEIIGTWWQMSQLHQFSPPAHRRSTHLASTSWSFTATTSSLSCRASQGSDTAAASHRWSLTSAVGVLLSCMPRKPAGKNSPGSSPCSTGLWGKLMPFPRVPPCRCGCAEHTALWVLTKGILVPWEPRKLGSQQLAWAVILEYVKALEWLMCQMKGLCLPASHLCQWSKRDVRAG